MLVEWESILHGQGTKGRDPKFGPRLEAYLVCQKLHVI